MSTPPEKPHNPIDHVSRKAREGAEGDNDPFRSPYAPRRAPERAGTERHPVDPLRSPYTPPKTGAVTSDFADDAEPLPTVRAPEGLREAEPHPRRDALGGGHM